MTGPTVRVAGRIMSNRDKGKVMFIDLEDQTARIQLFIGKSQVGEENWTLAQNFDLGDLIGAESEHLFEHGQEILAEERWVLTHGKVPDTPHDNGFRAGNALGRRAGALRCARVIVLAREQIDRRC